MKKVIGLVLVFVISCFTCSVMADDELNALALSAKQRLCVGAEYETLRAEKFGYNGTETINLDWSRDSGKEFINAEITVSGIITSYYATAVDTPRGISKFTKEEAAKLAKAWLKEVNPDIAEEYVFDTADIYMGYGITVTGNRYAGGARIVDDSVTVTLNAQTGQVSSMNLRYTEEEFTVPENIISEESAKMKFEDNTNLILAYIKSGDRAILVYTDVEKLYSPAFGIDAVTGDRVEIERSYFRETNGSLSFDAMADTESNKKADIELSEAEIRELSKYDGYITPEDGAEKILSIAEFGISDFELRTYRYARSYTINEENDETVILYLNFRKDSLYANAELDGRTGEIISFSCYNPNKTEEKITSEEAEKIADALAQKVANERTYIRTARSEDKADLSITVGYLETVNDIPYVNSGMNIAVDKSSGLVTAYSACWEREDIAFDEVSENKMPLYMAHKMYRIESEAELVFINIAEGDGNGQPYNYVLVYQRTDAPYAIDSVTGNRLLQDGEEEKEELTKYNDLENHWAREAVDSLIYNGYLSVKEKAFRPDAAITPAEALEIMRNAGIYGQFDELNNSEALSRSNAVKAFVCGMGYEEIGVLDIYKNAFSDWDSIAEDARGYIAIAKGFGIISGDNRGYFNPDEYMTRGAFAVMIYNYISCGIAG